MMTLLRYSTVILAIVSVVGVYGSTSKSKNRKDDMYNTFYSDTLQYTTDSIYSTLDWLSGSNQCPYHQDTYNSIMKNLNRFIKGQDEGVKTILNAISGWEFERQAGSSQPLVLALTGPTGVGKSETAFRIAEGALAKRRRVGKTAKYLPSGLLTLRGEDYARGSLDEIHESIRSRLVAHLEQCGGNAVVVFDEVQKVLPGTLEVLMPALESRGSISRTVQVPVESAFLFPTSTGTGTHSAVQSLLSYTVATTSEVVKFVSQGKQKNTASSSTNGGGSSGADSGRSTTESPAVESSKVRMKTVTTQHSTEHTIFIFISDIGADSMTKLVLSYGNRSLIPQTVLRNEVKMALDAQWQRLRFGKVVREVVPYLPLEPVHIREILYAKLRQTATDFRSTRWLDLLVDDQVVEYLSSPPLVKYSVVSMRNTVATGTAQLGQSKLQTPAGDGETGDSSSSSTVCVGTAGEELSGEAYTVRTQQTAPPASTAAASKVFATWGARSLENGGPLQDLRSLLQRHARPWRPDQLLHVGLLTEENRQARNAKWRTQEAAGTVSAQSQKQVYIQWCHATEAMRVCAHQAPNESSMPSHSADSSETQQEETTTLPHCSTEHSSEYAISTAVAFSAECDTLWFGPLLS